MSWQLVTTLPSGGKSRTVLGREGERFAVLRELESEPLTPPIDAGPGLVPFRDLVVVGGKRYGVYDVVEGVSYREIVDGFRQSGRLPPLGVLARLVIDAARAVARLGRPHGGLSDSALLLKYDGTAQVMDVGSARASRFAPPEASAFNDVFALAAVLHSTYAGFRGSYPSAAGAGQSFEGPSQHSTEVAPVVDDVLLRALAANPDERQPTPDAFADELEAILSESLFTPGDISMVLGSMLNERRAHLAKWLQREEREPEQATVTLPRLSEASDERTAAHLVPWTTGDSKERIDAVASDVPAPVEVARTMPLLDPFQPIPMRTEPWAETRLPPETIAALEAAQPHERFETPPETPQIGFDALEPTTRRQRFEGHSYDGLLETPLIEAEVEAPALSAEPPPTVAARPLRQAPARRVLRRAPAPVRMLGDDHLVEADSASYRRPLAEPPEFEADPQGEPEEIYSSEIQAIGTGELLSQGESEPDAAANPEAVEAPTSAEPPAKRRAAAKAKRRKSGSNALIAAIVVALLIALGITAAVISKKWPSLMAPSGGSPQSRATLAPRDAGAVSILATQAAPVALQASDAGSEVSPADEGDAAGEELVVESEDDVVVSPTATPTAATPAKKASKKRTKRKHR